MTRKIRPLLLAILGTPVLLGLAFITLWACGIIIYVPQPDLYRDFHREFPYTKVTGMAVAPLLAPPYSLKEGTAEFDRVMALPKLHGYQVNGPWRSIDQHNLDIATHLIFTPDVLAGEYPANCFDPGFALKIQTDLGPIDMLVCLRCEQVLVVKPDDSQRWTLVFSDVGLRSAKAFYVDCFVLNKLVPPAPAIDSK